MKIIVYNINMIMIMIDYDYDYDYEFKSNLKTYLFNLPQQ